MFDIKNPQHYQNQIGFLIYEGESAIGKIALANKEIQVKWHSKKFYQKFKEHNFENT